MGFEVEGVMKEEMYFNGKFHNFLSMAIFERNKN
jgi:RimJ/RimL family protein N-acetyltransferase